MAVCAAIVGKNNSPKFFCCINPDEELNFQYKVLSSLDIIDEKLNPSNKSASENRELYLGQLYALETCKIYGYVTNTKVKLIIVVDSSNMALRDNEIRSTLTGETWEHYNYSQVAKLNMRQHCVWGYQHLFRSINEISTSMFRKIHSEYVDMVSNPFYIPGEPITSKSFDTSIKSIITGTV